jgi:hypothetical protein
MRYINDIPTIEREEALRRGEFPQPSPVKSLEIAKERVDEGRAHLIAKKPIVGVPPLKEFSIFKPKAVVPDNTMQNKNRGPSTSNKL